jgi:iron(III) transport system substrate-binding protein
MLTGIVLEIAEAVAARTLAVVGLSREEKASRKGFRHLSLLLLAGFIAGTLAGCAKQGRYVTAYVSVDQIYSEPILKAFGNSTGIEVRAIYDVEAAKTTGLATRLIAEKDRPRADVFWNGEFAQTLRLKELRVLGACAPPSAAEIPSAFRDPDGYWYGLGGRARVFLVNRTLLKPEEYPKRLEDFLDSKYPPDRIGLALPLFGTSATHSAALFAVSGAGPAASFFRALKSRGIQVVDGNSTVRDRVAAGHWLFGLTDTDDALGAIERGSPVEVVAPDQDGRGTLVVPGTVAAVRGAPHTKEAALLMDYLLRRETERELIRGGFCQWSLRGDLASSPMFPSGLKAMTVSLSDVNRQLTPAMEQMREIFAR